MLSIISPAKSLDFDANINGLQITNPIFNTDSTELVGVLKSFSQADIKKLMHLSDKLAELNFSRYQGFADNTKVAKAAISVFKGDVYRYLDAHSFDNASLEFINEHALILSGLYGLLRPSDLMQPYRLEMGTKLATERGKNLYEFWGDKITQKINSILSKHKNQYLLNLASNEYISAVKKDKLKYPCIDVQFKVKKDNKYKIVGIEAKRARGAMLRAITENKIDKPEDILALNINSYEYAPALSSESNYVFTRK
jgi:uncharacterized protein